MSRILLVNPAYEHDPTGLPRSTARTPAARWAPMQMGIMPLAVATIAALTPPAFDVDIWDEAVEGPLDEEYVVGRRYQLAGVTGFINHAGRMNELGRVFRRLGIPAVVGGPGVSSEPELFREQFDVLFVGEAELTWPRFLAEFASGAHRREYRQVDKVDVTVSPVPRWDALRVDAYSMGCVQTTRGCPFDCEFCDVIYIYGRQARHKIVERVLEEVRLLARRGITRILFCDDNFIGNRRHARELAKGLIALNRSFRRPVAFFTNVTLNLARDTELLHLMADANFCGVFIGIESPSVDSLVEMNKPQNYSVDLMEAVAAIHGCGIIIQSGMIVGFDHDDQTIFDRHFAFLQDSGVPVPMLNLLKAPTGTKLWARLHKAGRVLRNDALRRTSNVEPLSNVLPLRMSMVDLLTGYRDLVTRIRDWRNFESRVRRLVTQVRRRPVVKQPLEWRNVTLLAIMLTQMRGRRARWTTLRLLAYTLWHAPFMAERVMGAVAYHSQEELRVPRLQAFLDGELQKLTRGEPLERERAVFFVPDGFRQDYPGVFPSLYARVRRGLANKSRTHDALVDVTRDFLARWGSDLDRLEDHHRRFLEELCDRIIAAENGSPGHGAEADATRFGPGGREAESALDSSVSRLAADVLRCVEQDLRAPDARGA